MLRREGYTVRQRERVMWVPGTACPDPRVLFWSHRSALATPPWTVDAHAVHTAVEASLSRCRFPRPGGNGPSRGGPERGRMPRASLPIESGSRPR